MRGFAGAVKQLVAARAPDFRFTRSSGGRHTTVRFERLVVAGRVDGLELTLLDGHIVEVFASVSPPHGRCLHDLDKYWGPALQHREGLLDESSQQAWLARIWPRVQRAAEQKFDRYARDLASAERQHVALGVELERWYRAAGGSLPPPAFFPAPHGHRIIIVAFRDFARQVRHALGRVNPSCTSAVWAERCKRRDELQAGQLHPCDVCDTVLEVSRGRAVACGHAAHRDLALVRFRCPRHARSKPPGPTLRATSASRR
jgi:hypothetical protein